MLKPEAIVGLWRIVSDHGDSFAAFFADHIYAAPSHFRRELYTRGHWSLEEGTIRLKDVCRPAFPAMGSHSIKLTVRELSEQRMITETENGRITTWERLGGEPDINPTLDPFALVEWRLMHRAFEESSAVQPNREANN